MDASTAAAEGEATKYRLTVGCLVISGTLYKSTGGSAGPLSSTRSRYQLFGEEAATPSPRCPSAKNAPRWPSPLACLGIHHHTCLALAHHILV